MSHGEIDTKVKYENPAGFEFDPNRAQVITSPVFNDPDLIFAALYNGTSSAADFSKNDGSLEATGGGADVDGFGNLVLRDASATRFVNYAGALNVDTMLQKGTVRVRWIPRYDGSPPNSQRIIDVLRNSDSAAQILLAHVVTTGRVNLTLRDSSGGTVVVADLGVFSAVKNEPTEWEFNLDADGGSHRLFIDGEQQGPVVSDVYARGGENADVLRLGGTSPTFDADFDVDFFAVFAAVKHTAPYTPEGEDGIVDDDATTGAASLVTDRSNANALMFAKYNGAVGRIDADFSSVSETADLDATPSGATSPPTTDGANLELLGGATVQSLRVDYDPQSLVFDNPNQGSIVLRAIIADVSSGRQFLWHMSNGNGANSLIQLHHDPVDGDDTLRFKVTESDGTVIIDDTLTDAAIADGNAFTAAILWDLDNFGSVAVRINGVERLQQDLASTERRDNLFADGALRIGDTSPIVGGIESGANFEVDFWAVFEGSADAFTLDTEAEIFGQTLDEDGPPVTPVGDILATQFVGFEENVDLNGNGNEVRWTICVDGVEFWNDGVAWLAADGTKEETTLASLVDSEAESLFSPTPSGKRLRAVAYLLSAEATSPFVFDHTLSTSQVLVAPAPPAECSLRGVVLENGIPVEGVVVFLDHAGFLHGENFVDGKRLQDTTAADGTFTLQVPETATIPLSPYTLGLGSRRYTKVSIPNQPECTLEDLNLPATPA